MKANRWARIVSFMVMLAFTFGSIGFVFTSPVQAAGLALGMNSCATVINSNSAGGLAVRNAPGTSAGLIKRIKDGTLIKLLEGPISKNGYTWWRHDQGGWSASSYMRDTACPSTPAPVIDVNAARNALKKMNAMKSPWTQVDAPLKNSSPRSSAWYGAVIDQFDVASADFAGRYKAGGAGLSDTRCNIFAGDVMRAMSAPLPTKGELGVGASGSVKTDPMTANATHLNDFLNGRRKSSNSANSGWRLVDPSTPSGLNTLIAHVNAGKPAVASSSGHIAVIRPGQSNVTKWQDLLIAQAGAKLFLSGRLSEGFGSIRPQFFLHD